MPEFVCFALNKTKHFLKFSADCVKKQLLKIKIDKASGPARILRDAASELAVVLSTLFQQSYDSGTLPCAWKLANIWAIFKKGHKADPKNYRLVSLTSLTSKVTEHIVSCQISRHLSTNHIICPHQHGFQRGLSCETQLVTVIYEWASVLNVHGQVNMLCSYRLRQSFWLHHPWTAFTKGQLLRNS